MVAGGLLVIGGLLLEAGRRALLDLVSAAPAQSQPEVQPGGGGSFYRLAWGDVVMPTEVRAGTPTQVSITVRNSGNGTWPDPALADPQGHSGKGAVRFSYRWWDGASDTVISGYQTRQDLPRPVAAGASVTVPLDVNPPAMPGRYRLQVDLVHELVGWFELRGAERLIVPVTVVARTDDGPAR